MSDPAAAYERLKIETAEMLKLDAANLSLVEGLQLDLVSLLRLEVDGLQGAVLAGDPVDLTRLVAAHGMLQKMLPERALVAPAPAATNHDFAGAKEELDRLLADRAERLQYREQKESERLAAENAQLREEIAQLQAHLKAVPQQQQQPEKPQQPTNNNVVPIDARERMRIEAQAAKERVAKESAQNERAFRDYYGGGALCAPGIDIDPRK